MDQMNKYETDIQTNQKTFDYQKVKDCDNLEELCFEYYAGQSSFPLKNYDQLIQSIMVSQHPLVG